MKQIMHIILISFVLSCVSTNQNEILEEESTELETAPETPRFPDWILLPPREEGYFFGIGGDPDLETAKIKSLINISQQFQVHVYSELQEYITKSENNDKPFLKSLEKQITDNEIIGAKYNKQYQDSNGDYWILSRAPFSCILDVTESVLINYRKDLKIGKEEIENITRAVSKKLENNYEYVYTLTGAKVEKWRSLELDMIKIPAGNFRPGNKEIVYIREFAMANTELTWQQWKGVYDWAVDNGYNFANTGQPGSYKADGITQPVAMISWYDAIIWCNAATEMANFLNSTFVQTVYNHNGRPIRDSSNASKQYLCDIVMADSGAEGLRLPTSHEWEYGARYKDGNTWTSLDYTSGASGDNESAIDRVGWYQKNSNGRSHPVGQKQPNALKLYDMSGNVWEWCFDWHPDYAGSYRVIRGGSWYYTPDYLQVGVLSYSAPGYGYGYGGFRPACNP